MSEDRTNAARQARYQARKKAEFESLKLRVKEFESREIKPLDDSIIKSIIKTTREQDAQYCETNEEYPTTGKFLADGIRGME